MHPTGDLCDRIISIKSKCDSPIIVDVDQRIDNFGMQIVFEIQIKKSV